MKTLIVYTSQTGYTKMYAEKLAERLQADCFTVEELKKKDDAFFGTYDAIVYGGWAMAGKVVKSEWLLGKAPSWKDKKLAIFCVGATPVDSPLVEQAMAKVVPDELKSYVGVFYCPGGLNYDKMKLPSKMMMKAYASMLAKKKDQTEDDKKMAEMIAQSYDISDVKYLDPIVEYIEK